MNRRAAAGFTLQEILVVLAVFGFLLVGSIRPSVSA